MEYYDKHGEQIKAGYTIKHDDGSTEKVYECGIDNLGVNASNTSSSAFIGLEECYPLSEFYLDQWEIVDRG